MRSRNLLIPCLALSAALFTVACGDDKGGTDTDATTTNTTGTATDTSLTGTTTDTTGTTAPTTGAPTTGTPTTETTTSPTTTSPTTGTTGDDPFMFDETPPGDLVQIDRMGMPAVATAVISSGMKDAYNEATPADDAMQAFVMDIVANVTALHAALDDDLMGAGLTPCALMDCLTVAAPLVVPDTLKIDTNMPSGFPNGRRLADPVVDVTLAVVLLDLMTHAPDVLANLPLNPPMNDKEFLADFPYVADPH